MRSLTRIAIVMSVFSNLNDSCIPIGMRYSLTSMSNYKMWSLNKKNVTCEWSVWSVTEMPKYDLYI